MIDGLVEQWEQRKGRLREWFEQEHPGSYSEIVERLVSDVLNEEWDGQYGKLDPSRVHRIDDGHYQGTELYLIPLDRYQPSADAYVWFHNHYGSCSGCDTLESIRNYERDPPDEDQVEAYMRLALHMVQRMKWLDREDPDAG